MLPDWFNQLGLMGWPLVICAVVALTVCFERVGFLVKSHINQNKQYQTLSAYLGAHKQQPKPVRDEVVSIMLSELKAPYYRGLKTLRIIGTISPLIGLLGTVLGIIAAFKIIAVQTGPVSPSMIADGLWEAMLTTAAGLLIALPALLLVQIFHHYSDRQISQYCLQLNKLSMTYELEKDPKKTERVGTGFGKLSA